VGPRCIVAWRARPGGAHRDGGGQLFYNGTSVEGTHGALPSVNRGMELKPFFETFMQHMLKRSEARRTGGAAKGLDADLLNKELALLPDTPDEKLR
jgi:hypothetical protein